MSLADDALSALTAGAKGGAAGAALGPIGAAAGAAIGVAMELLPGAAHWLGADAATAQKAVDVVQQFTGIADPAAQRMVIAADQGLADDLRVQLAQIANERRAEENRSMEARLATAAADTAGARQHTLQFAQMGSTLAWGAPVVSVIVMVTFGVMAYLVMFRAVPEGSMNLAQGLLEALKTLGIVVVSYWCGSSAGSARKDDRLANMVPVPPSPGVVVPAADVQPAR